MERVPNNLLARFRRVWPHAKLPRVRPIVQRVEPRVRLRGDEWHEDGIRCDVVLQLEVGVGGVEELVVKVVARHRHRQPKLSVLAAFERGLVARLIRAAHNREAREAKQVLGEAP